MKSLPRLLVIVPLIAFGVTLAHALADMLCGSPTAGELFTRHGVLAHGEGPASAVAIVMTIAGFASALAGGTTRQRIRAARALAAAPAVAFVVLELTEAIVEHEGTSAILDPACLVGLLLVLPFCALAWLIARGLLRAASALRAVLTRRRRLAPRRREASVLVGIRTHSYVAREHRSRLRGRAPPLGLTH